MKTKAELEEMNARYLSDRKQLNAAISSMNNYRARVSKHKKEQIEVLKSFEAELIKMFVEEYSARNIYKDYFGIETEIGVLKILLNMTNNSSLRIHFHFDGTSKPELTDVFYRTHVTYTEVNEKHQETREKIEEVLKMRNED